VAAHFDDALNMATVTQEVILQGVTSFVRIVRELNAAILPRLNISVSKHYQ
jgi:hypothetical protein